MENKIKELQSQVSKLEKALDLACLKLEYLDRKYAEERNKHLDNNWSRRIVFGCRTAKDWKDWMLDEAEDYDG